jgi:hypothetical protein
MLSIFARANVRIYSPAKHVLSNVEGTLSSQSPSTQPFFFAAPTLISPNLASFAPLREVIFGSIFPPRR